MKTLIKKIAYTFSFLALVGFGFAAVPTQVSAFVAFNNDPQDYATFRGMNVSDYPNGTTWISTTVSGDAGETISFDIYYHNTGNTTATNVKLKVTPESTGTGTSHTVSGSIAADGFGGLSDSVSVSLSSSQSLTYIDNSATWFPNQTTSGTAISDSSLFSSGINIGSVPPGWSSQGHLRVQFKVSGSADTDDAQCNDGEDNDGDGFTDMEDPSCDSIYDDSESPFDGADASAPSVSTLSALDVDENSALLRGEADANGDSIDNCWFEWGTNDAIDDLDNTEDVSCSIADDDTEIFTQTLSGLSDDEDYFYRACAENAEGTDCGSIVDFTTDTTDDGGGDAGPNVSTLSESGVDEDSATLNGEVDANDDSVTNCWFEWGTNDAIDDLDNTEDVSCSIDSGDTEEFSETISGLNDNEDYFYRACAESDLGEDCGSIVGFTTDNGDVFVDDNSDVSVVTTSATSVTQTSATLSGFVYNTSNDNPTGWFEYGPSTSMGLYSSQQLLGSNSTLSYFNTVTGLSANTTYFYRAVVRADDGTLKYGQVLSFRTLSYSVPTVPVVIYTGTTISTGSGNGDIMLTIDSRYENVYMGDIVDYTLTYKNISGKTLQNATLRVLFPQNINFRNSSIGDYSLADHALTIQLGTLIPNQTGTFYIQGQVATNARLGELLVTTASLVYTDPKGAQQEAIAYEMNRVSTSRNPLLGLAFFSGFGFFPNTLLEWLILILLIFIVVHYARKLYARRSTSPNFN